MNKSENLPYSLCFIQTPGKGFIDGVYVADILRPSYVCGSTLCGAGVGPRI